MRYYKENNDNSFRWLYHNTLKFFEDTLCRITLMSLILLLMKEMGFDRENPPVWMSTEPFVNLVVRLRAFRYTKPAVRVRPLVEFKNVKHILSIRRYSSKNPESFKVLSPEEVHKSAINNLSHLYGLIRPNMTVTSFDIFVSAREAMCIPAVAHQPTTWDPVTKALEAIESGEGVIILLHGCDALSMDMWSIRKLYDYYQSICIYLIIKESDVKLLDSLDTDLSERIISHWREGTDGFHYGKFRLADIINSWGKDEGDLTYVDLLATHLISLWEKAFARRLDLCEAIRASDKILLRGRNSLTRL